MTKLSLSSNVEWKGGREEGTRAMFERRNRRISRHVKWIKWLEEEINMLWGAGIGGIAAPNAADMR
jgi:hypothetical protein